MHSVFLEFLPTLYPTNISAAYIVSAEQTEKNGRIPSLQITVLVNYTRHDLRTGFQRKLSCKPLTGLTRLTD